MSVRIDGYPIDAVASIVSEHEGEPTQYPVERAEDYTDNVRILPFRLVLDGGVVSDSPLGALAAERRGPSGQDVTIPSAEARARLVAIHAAREPVTVETGNRVYVDMILFRLSIQDDAAGGQALRFTAEFQRLRIRDTARTPVKVSEARAARKKSLGTKTPKAVGHDAGAFIDPTTGVPTSVSYDPETGRYVNEATNKPLTRTEQDAWLEQNGGDPYYRSPRELGPGAATPRRGSDVGEANEGPPPYFPGYTDPIDQALEREQLLTPGGGDQVSDPSRVLDPGVAP